VEAGFYFEEGGCIGMALALRDTLRRYGVEAPLALWPGSFRHAGVLVGRRFLDSSGLGVQDTAAKTITQRQLLDVAGKWGNTHEDVLSAKEWAQQAIDIALEEGGADAPPVIGSRKRTNPRRRNPEDDYRMRHRPNNDGPRAHELGAGELPGVEWSMPEDVMTHPERYTGFRRYLPGFWPSLRAAQHRPKAVLRIYRALPKPHATFREGDWVTLSRDYAQEHLESNLGDEGHIIEANVPADTLRFAGDDLMEWGYWGPTVEAAPVRRRRNPRPTTAERTDPALWEAVKREVTAGSKGGVRGEWSARKAQLAVALYKKRGGGYLGPKSPRNALAKWTREDWRTRSGEPSLVTGERYLPARAIAALSPAEYVATTRAKREGMRRGEQFTPQPERIAAKTARYRKNPRRR
jgi:hypothetical protein